MCTRDRCNNPGERDYPMSMWDRLAAIERRYDELAEEMARPEVASDYERYQELAKEQAGIAEAAGLYSQYRKLSGELDQAKDLAFNADDREMRELGQEELERIEHEIEPLTERLKLAILPRDPRDERNVILEIRGAEGGEEAAL